jgi:predicted acetyltransferase
MALRLRPLRLDDEDEAVRAHGELAADGFPFLLDWDPDDRWAAYVHRCAEQRRGRALPAGWVPSTFLAAVLDGRLVGRISVRHELNAFLASYGGHIGYCVRPADRGRGLAGEILRQGLVVARAEGVDRVLVTCDADNVASARVIEANGGVLEDVRDDPAGPPKRRYWID